MNMQDWLIETIEAGSSDGDIESIRTFGEAEEWLEAVEPTSVEPTPKFKAGDKVILTKDGFGFSGLVGCKGTVTAYTQLRTAYGNLYAVDTTWHNGCVANYEIPESQMELAATEITPVEQNVAEKCTAEKVAAIIELIRPDLMKAVRENVEYLRITLGRDEEEWGMVIGFDNEDEENGQEEQTCRICGCTCDNACEGGGYCVEEALCSKCAEKREEEEGG